MRKISAILGKKVFSADKGEFLGTITGVLCENRLKSVDFFNIVIDEQAVVENKYFAPRSIKKINDDSVILSNNLCIKNSDDIDAGAYIFNPLGFAVFDGSGTAIGTLDDIHIGDTVKTVENLISGETVFSASRVATVAGDTVALLPEGRKRIRSTSPKKIKKDCENFVVFALETPIEKDDCGKTSNTKNQEENTFSNADIDKSGDSEFITVKEFPEEDLQFADSFASSEKGLEKESDDAYRISNDDSAVENSQNGILNDSNTISDEQPPSAEVLPLAEIINTQPRQRVVMPSRIIGNYRFLLGRVVTANIYNFHHQLIIKTGTLITAQVVETAHKHGKLVDLTLHSKV